MKNADKIKLLDRAAEMLTEAENLLLQAGMHETQIRIAAVYQQEIAPERRHLATLWAREIRGCRKPVFDFKTNGSKPMDMGFFFGGEQ